MSPFCIVLQVIDFSNRAQDVERAVLEFAQPRRVRASRFEDVVSLSAELKAGLVYLPDNARGRVIKWLIIIVCNSNVRNVQFWGILHLRACRATFVCTFFWYWLGVNE